MISRSLLRLLEYAVWEITFPPAAVSADFSTESISPLSKSFLTALSYSSFDVNFTSALAMPDSADLLAEEVSISMPFSAEYADRCSLLK